MNLKRQKVVSCVGVCVHIIVCIGLLLMRFLFLWVFWSINSIYNILPYHFTNRLHCIALNSDCTWKKLSSRIHYSLSPLSSIHTFCRLIQCYIWHIVRNIYLVFCVYSSVLFCSVSVDLSTLPFARRESCLHTWTIALQTQIEHTCIWTPCVIESNFIPIQMTFVLHSFRLLR